MAKVSNKKTISGGGTSRTGVTTTTPTTTTATGSHGGAGTSRTTTTSTPSLTQSQANYYASQQAASDAYGEAYQKWLDEQNAKKNGTYVGHALSPNNTTPAEVYVNNQAVNSTAYNEARADAQRAADAGNAYQVYKDANPTLGQSTTSEVQTQPTYTAPTYTAPQSVAPTNQSQSVSVPQTTLEETPVDEQPLQSAYDEVYAAYQKALEEEQARQRANYEASLEALRGAYDQSKTGLTGNNDDALRQAYISYMLGRRGLEQQLANNGITGGAAESVYANLYNAYGNNRENIAKQYANALNDLTTQYNSGVANLGANYGSDSSDALINYYNQMAGVKENYANDLAKMLQTAQEAQFARQRAYDTQRAQAAENAAQQNVIQPWNNSDRKTVVNTVANLKSNPSSVLAYLNNFPNATNEEKDLILYEAGIDPATLAASLYGTGNAYSSGLGSQQSTTPAVPVSNNYQNSLQDTRKNTLNLLY